MNSPSRLIKLLLTITTLGLCTSAMLPELASAQDVGFSQVANPGADVTTTDLESAVIAEINRMRTNPSAYAAWLEEVKAYYDGTTLAFPNEARVRTVEGVAAVEDAIAVLSQLDPLPPLERSAGLSRAAHDHVQDLMRIGALTLTGSDGSQPEDRVGRYGELSGQAAELLNYGNQTAAGLVMQLVISDGNPNRTSRATLLRSDFTVMGVGCDRMSQQMLCVLDYASDYTDNEGLSNENLNAEASAETAEPVETVSSKVDSVDSTTRTETPRAATPIANQDPLEFDASAQAAPVQGLSNQDAPDQDMSQISPHQQAAVSNPADTNAPDPEPSQLEQAITDSSSDADRSNAIQNSTDSAAVPVAPGLNATEIAAAPPSASPSGFELSEVERALIEETNLLRANPAAYAEKLEQLLPHYDGLQLKLPNQSFILETEEGVSAVEEAIAVLRATDALPLLEPMAGLSLGANDHAVDLGLNNLTGHYGSDDSDPFERISRYGTYHDIAGENISYSPIHTAEWHVIQWLIDDGVSDRGHRETLLKPEYQVTGVACEPHAGFGNVCVMTYAGEYTNNEGIETAVEVVQR